MQWKVLTLQLLLLGPILAAAEGPAPGSAIELFGTIGKDLGISMNLAFQQDPSERDISLCQVREADPQEGFRQLLCKTRECEKDSFERVLHRRVADASRVGFFWKAGGHLPGKLHETSNRRRDLVHPGWQKDLALSPSGAPAYRSREREIQDRRLSTRTRYSAAGWW